MKIINSNIVDATESIIAHGCNCSGAFAAGVARAIAKKWPKAREEYLELHKNAGLKLGQIQVVDCDEKKVVNMFTQWSYGKRGRRYVDYDALEDCFSKTLEWMEENDHKSLAIPMIGAGLGGGDWDEICKRIINVNNKHTDIEIVVYYIEK